MITYFKTTPENLFFETYIPEDIRVKTMMFRDNDETCSIDVISLDSCSRFVCYEQWSIPGNKKDYHQCHEELRRYIGRQQSSAVGKYVFEKFE